jgi:hypothetical protein
MKQYLLSMYYGANSKPPSREALATIMSDVAALRQEMKQAGVWVFGGGLHPPSSATVVRIRNGEAITTDGPYAEAKEHIGGFNIIAVADLDAALGWAKKFSKAVTLPIEIWPFQEEGRS